MHSRLIRFCFTNIGGSTKWLLAGVPRGYLWEHQRAIGGSTIDDLKGDQVEILEGLQNRLVNRPTFVHHRLTRGGFTSLKEEDCSMLFKMSFC